MEIGRFLAIGVAGPRCDRQVNPLIIKHLDWRKRKPQGGLDPIKVSAKKNL